MSYARDHLTPLIDEGLGNSAYLADLGGGRALAVDASRDLRALRQAASRRGLKIAFAADTHLHADFLTGAVQLAADEGATALASAAGHREFAHIPLADEDEVDLGGLTLRALATPGHTDEHLSYLLLDGSQELGVFTGGSLIVGSAARTDLLGAGRAGELARAQYRSLRQLAALPDATPVWPTHGAGSFCSAPPGAARVTTIGTENAGNALLNASGEDAFTRHLLASLGSYPAYFGHLAEVNRRSPAPLAGDPGLGLLTPAALGFLMDAGGWLIDVRPIAAFAAGTFPARCPSRSAGSSPPGWAGWYRTERRWASCSRAARTRPRWPGRPSRSATRTWLGSWMVAWPPGRRTAGPSSAPRWSRPTTWTAARSWTSGKTPNTGRAMSPGRPISSSATCGAGRRTCPARRW